MATVRVFTAERMRQIENNSITNADIIDGNLILQRYDGSQVNTGKIAGSVFNPMGDWSSEQAYYKMDLVQHDGKSWMARNDIAIGLEPGVNSGWQMFGVSSEDLRAGNHEITGVFTFINESPIIPAASHVTRAANLGDVKTEIAQEPMLLNSALDELTFSEESGDIRPIITKGIVRSIPTTFGGVYFPHANSTVESAAQTTAVFPVGSLANNSRILLKYNGILINNSGSSVTYTFRIYGQLPSASPVLIASDALVIPTNSPANDNQRPFSIESNIQGSNLLGDVNLGAYGTTKFTVGPLPTETTNNVIDRLRVNTGVTGAIRSDKITTIFVTVQMSVAHAKAAASGMYATAERFTV